MSDGGSTRDEGQRATPYLDALREYAARDPARLHVPGHKGGAGADAGLLEAIGERALSLDIPALTYGIDVGPEPTPFEAGAAARRRGVGREARWFLINGASQGNLAAGLALAHRGGEVVVQRNAHSSTIDALVLSGLRPTFVVARARPGARDRALPHARDARRRARGDARRRRARGSSRRPTSAPSPTCARSPRSRTRRGVRADRRRGVGRAPGLPRGAARARARGRAPTS